MKKFKKLKTSQARILNELLRNCKQSDRGISKIADISQPTVTRFRNHLERTNVIKEYLAIPDYKKLGFNFGAIITADISSKDLKEIPLENVIVSAPTISCDTNTMLIVVYREMEDFNRFLRMIKPLASDLYITLFDTRGFGIKSVQV